MFNWLCDLLNVNTLEREQAGPKGISSLDDLVFIHVLEDSAERRGQDLNEAHHFNVRHAAMAHIIRECPEDQLPDPSAPDVPFGPKLPPKLSVV